MAKKLLVLCGLDFKEKSIQVIRKTAEAYVRAGWQVKYIIARDNADRGDYFYEAEINPQGVEIERFPWPFTKIRNASKSRWSTYFWTRLAGVAVVFMLARKGVRALRREPADVVYGYEIHGVLAAKLARQFSRVARQAKLVHRFQGTWLTEILDKKQWLRLLANADHVLALRSACDLAIMTDDGTRGDLAMKRLKSPAVRNLRFWVNGTDIPSHYEEREEFRSRLGLSKQGTVLVSVSRLEGWKRVDRGIAIASALSKRGVDCTYVIVGEGGEAPRLKALAAELGLADRVRFEGALPQQRVFDYMHGADIFLSMYDLSNVGNPLLEAIRMQKIVVTLDNGDTGSWIKHFENGLIYDPSSWTPEIVAGDIEKLLSDPSLRERVLAGIASLARNRLWTWEERMRGEVEAVAGLVSAPP